VTLAQICARQALECLDLTDAFRVDGRADEYFFENDGHWTERGHAVAARAVAAWVRERFLKDGMGGRS
jgi:lysophospholipase L1-like esterase